MLACHARQDSPAMLGRLRINSLRALPQAGRQLSDVHLTPMHRISPFPSQSCWLAPVTLFFPSLPVANALARSPDIYNAERVELSSGPNAILFGLGSPGGMFNASTKRAQTNRSFVTIQTRVGSYHLFRNSLDWNKPLIVGKLALRMNLLNQE